MLKFSANLSIMFTEAPFLERFALAAKHGFAGVECWFPYECPKDEIAARLNDNGLRCIGINTAPGDTARSDWGLAIFPERRTDFLAGVDQAIEYAIALNCHNIHVMAGMMEAGAPAARYEASFIEHVAIAAERARAAGKTVLIEPLSPIDRPGYFLSTQAQARRIVSSLHALNAVNVKIMFDVYHVQMTEGNIVKNFHASLPQIGHIQIADVPGRHEPGTGEINFPFVLSEIANSGYDAWIGCEYKPRSNTALSLAWRDRMELLIVRARGAVKLEKLPDL
jgi:2-dehydrotetronate isomerase